MKSLFTAALMMMAVLFSGIGLLAYAQPESESADKTLSPYFLVKSDDPGVEQMPLKSTSADVNIAGVIADVKVTQVYKNEGQKTLEAVYVFPASTRASVYGMKMTIGERVIVAKVQEREKARQEYEQAKQEGKSASLLEQQRPNVFQMNVANILPKDEIKVELSYTELLIPDDGVYEFMYPTVVGPRYSNKPEAGAPASEKWVKNPYLHQGEAPLYTFDIKVNIAGSMPIQDVTCNSHKTTTSFDGPALATIKLDASEKTSGNRDYILKYRLTGGQIETGILLSKGESENFFLLMMQPPQKISPSQIPPREYIFIVDVSGSMHGFPLDISKKLLSDLIGGLRPIDKFNVLLFSGGSTVMAEQSLPATQENISKAIQVIDTQTGGGGTELLPALKRALALPGIENVSRSLVIVTDGYVAVEKEAFDLIRNNLGNANMFSFGIGSAVNRLIIEGMARVGMGEPFILTKPDEAPARAAKFREYIQTPLLTHAKVNFEGFEAYDVEPPGLPDMLANRPVVVFGKWKGAPKGTIKLTGLSGEKTYTATVDVSQAKPQENNSALRYLWARHKITLLSDYNKLASDDKRIKEITELGLAYNLLTDYTSFVAIDSLVRAKPGDSTTVQQPLPLPQGVSNYAVGGQQVQAMPKMAMQMQSPTPAKPMAMPDMAAAPRSSAPEPPIMKEAVIAEIAEIKKAEAKERKKQLQGVVHHLLEKMAVTGNLSKEAAERLIENHLKELEACWQKVQEANPALQGNVVLKISVDGNGKVTAVEWISKDLSAEDLKSCVTKTVKAWKFDAPADGKPAVVEYSLSFSNRLQDIKNQLAN